MSKVGPTQKYGYVDIKQSSRVRPRKLKTWKRRWVVLTTMSNLSNEEYVAKLDLYDNEAKWRGNSSDKVTFVLENVTCIRPVKSKTHKHAFEVIQEQPMLVISGATELDSYSWMVSLQQIFTPDLIEAKKDCYHVIVIDNEDSRKWKLTGNYTLTVSATCLSLENSEGTSVVSWALNSLVRFHVEQELVPEEHGASLLIECGPKSSTGHSFFSLQSNQAENILGAIRQSICLALTLKQNERMSSSTRHRSHSVTNSEKNFQKLFDSQSLTHLKPQPVTHNNAQSAPLSIPMGRSHSGSSMSSFGSPVRAAHSPSSSLTTGHFSAEFSSFLEIDENIERYLERDLPPAGTMSSVLTQICGRRRSCSHPETPCMANDDYSDIKDITDELKTVSRRNTITGEPADLDFDRLRSVSAVVASLKANNQNSKSAVSSSPQNKHDDKSDFDSAFSSMALSVTNEDLPWKEEQPYPGTVCAGEQGSSIPTRRRSSSTPDLQAYWKMNRFENVYEELSDVGASVHRLNLKAECETPPQLPARPLLADHTRTGTKNRSLLKMHRMQSLQDDNYTTDRLCDCNNVKVARWPLKDVENHACNCDRTTDRRKTALSEIFPKAKQADSLLSTINDINSIILQVQNVKRRRSSDITPVAASFVSTSSSDINYSQKTRQQWQIDSLAGFSQSMSPVPLNLIDLQDNTDNCQFQQRASEFLPNQAQNNILDSLSHFFLGDGDLSTKPTVTTTSAVCQPQPPCDPAHLTKSSYSFPTISVKVNQASTSKTSTWPGLGNRREDISQHLELFSSQTESVESEHKTRSNVSRDRVETSFQDFWTFSSSRGPRT